MLIWKEIQHLIDQFLPFIHLQRVFLFFWGKVNFLEEEIKRLQALFPQEVTKGKNEMSLIHYTPALKHTITSELFCMNFINEEFGAYFPPPWPVHSFRTFRAGWGKVEPTEGSYNFSAMDFSMSLLESKGYDVLCVLSGIPSWITSIEDLDANHLAKLGNYVEAVVSRYRGRITYYELWNEPEQEFIGKASLLVKFSKVMAGKIKLTDPNAVIISPAINITSGETQKDLLRQFFSLGGDAICDVIGYHSYVAPLAPELIMDRAVSVREIMASYGITKPLWNTETGWNIENPDTINLSQCGTTFAGGPITDIQAQGYIARTYLMAWISGVERFYWYAFAHGCMGFTDWSRVAFKTSAFAYAGIQNWIVNRRIKAMYFNPVTKIWTVILENASQQKEFIIWSSGFDVSINIDSSWSIEKSIDIFGKIRSLSSKDLSLFLVTGTPIKLIPRLVSETFKTDVVSLIPSDPPVPDIPRSLPQNLLKYSEDFTAPVWQQVTAVAPNIGVDPLGQMTADKLSQTVNTFNFCLQGVANPISPGDTYTASIWLKLTGQNEGDGKIDLRLSRLSGGAFEETIKKVDLTSSWARYSVTHTFINHHNGSRFQLGYVSGQASEVLAWGAQMNEGIAVKEYAATGSQIVSGI